MNLEQYKEYIDFQKSLWGKVYDYVYVSADTLFKKDEFEGLTHQEKLSKAIELGWGWDFHRGKYYKMVVLK